MRTEDTRMLRIVKIIAGLVLAALGGLWALQGADLIRMQPILCVANCAPLVGGSPTWLTVGLVTLVIGVLLLLPRRQSTK